MIDVLISVMVLPNVPWSANHALGRVLTLLNDQGQPPKTLIVGGAVRNAVIGREIADYDLATILTPQQVIERTCAAGLKAVPTGIEHGTVTVVVDGRGFEVTTLRRDVQTDGRHAVVAFTTDWRVDASRRDFTLNTLLADFEGHVFDPLGTGLEDAQMGRVRFVGEAAERIAEDYLRILRFFRFQAHYGRGEPDAAAVAACAAMAPHLRDLSRERVTQEILKWIRASRPVDTFKIAIKNNILSYVFNYSLDVMALERLVVLQQSNNQPEEMARLLALTQGTSEPLLQGLVLSGQQRSFLDHLARARLEPALDSQSLRRDAARFGQNITAQRAMMGGCTDISSLQNGWGVPEFPLSGKDILAAGGVQGPELGAFLSYARQIWIDHNFEMTAPELLALRHRFEADIAL